MFSKFFNDGRVELKQDSCISLRNDRQSAVEADRMAKLFAVVHAAFGDDLRDAADVADVCERVAVNEDQVGAFAGFNCAGYGVETHGSRGGQGCGLDGRHWRHAGLHVKLELAVEAVSNQACVAAGDDGDAGFVES